jgi:hypothetical protein
MTSPIRWTQQGVYFQTTIRGVKVSAWPNDMRHVPEYEVSNGWLHPESRDGRHVVLYGPDKDVLARAVADAMKKIEPTLGKSRTQAKRDLKLIQPKPVPAKPKPVKPKGPRYWKRVLRRFQPVGFRGDPWHLSWTFDAETHSGDYQPERFPDDEPLLRATLYYGSGFSEAIESYCTVMKPDATEEQLKDRSEALFALLPAKPRFPRALMERWANES